MQDTATIAIDKTVANERKTEASRTASDNLQSGVFSKKMRLEVPPDEYDALLDFVADPEPQQFSDKLKKAIREELIRMEQAK